LIKPFDLANPPTDPNTTARSTPTARPIDIPNAAAAHEVGVATAFQDLAFRDKLGTVSNPLPGREVRGHGALNEAIMEETARSASGRIGARLPPVRTKMSVSLCPRRQPTAAAVDAPWPVAVRHARTDGEAPLPDIAFGMSSPRSLGFPAI
jgi:hypothetical protein